MSTNRPTQAALQVGSCITVLPFGFVLHRPRKEEAMLEHELRSLAHAADQPSVTLLLTTSGLTDSELWARLRSQSREAIQRVLAEDGPDAALELADLLDETIGGTSLRPGQRSIAVFVNRRLQRTVPLMTEVRDRVVVDSTFATRDLVRAAQRSPRYRVLTLSERATRLFEGHGYELHEVRGLGFPFAIEPDEMVRPGASRRAHLQRTYVSEVDRALRSHHTEDPLPIIVVGVEPRISTVTNRSAFRHDIVGTVRARCDYPEPEQLAQLVAPITEAMIEADMHRATRELNHAAGDRVALGMSDVWNLANQGRGDLLIVEEGFTYPARLDPIYNQAIPHPDPRESGIIDDLVDETIEVVFAKRGRCAVVPDGTLPNGAGIALKLRY